MRVTIYQPQYFPRLHYFNRILDADVFVVLDSAQYTKVLTHFDKGRKKHKSYQSHAPIKLPGGEYILSVPVKHKWFLPINETQIEYNNGWVPEHLRTIQLAYGRSPNFHQFFPQIEEILSQQYKNLAELNIKTILWGVASVLGIKIPLQDLTIEHINRELDRNQTVRLKKILRDKGTGVQKTESKKGDEWIMAICKSLGATEHYHGETSKAGYMDVEYYKNLGITPITQNWHCKKYTQQFSNKNGFIPNLSIIDLLLNVGEVGAYNALVPESIKKGQVKDVTHSKPSESR